MSYWYEHRHEIKIGDRFIMDDGEIVEISGSVPGDGTALTVLQYDNGSWFDYQTRIEPGDLRDRLNEGDFWQT